LLLVDNKISALSRSQMNELKDEIAELSEQLRQVHDEQTNIVEER
jgi:cellobiose-specific phosphotransferase system component IIA